MAGGAQLSVPDMRRSTRHPVDFPVIGEHRTRGDLKLHVCNLSAHGFMVEAFVAFNRLVMEFLERVSAEQQSLAG